MVRILEAMAILAQAPGTAGDQSAPPAAHRTAEPDLRFAGAAQRRSLPYETSRGLIFVRGNVAGREVWVLIDTGASRTIVDAGLARAAGLATEAATASLATPSGPLAAQRVRNLRLGFPGRMDARLPLALSADLGPVSAMLGRRVEAVLGWDILARVAMLVDPAGATLEFGESGMLSPPAGAASVPLSTRGRIPVRVGKENVSLLVDLGSNHNVGLCADAWARLAPEGAATRPIEVGHGQGRREARRAGVLPQVIMGHATFRNVSTAIEPGRPEEGDGHVGLGLLSGLVFMLDAGAGRMWFLPAQRTASPRPSQDRRAPVPPPGPGR